MNKKYYINILFDFLKNKSGAYSIIMGLITIVLVGFIALIIDGSGMLIDKARFHQGLEQAGLVLVAENNKFRKEANHYDVTRQDIPKNSKDALNVRKDYRNKEIISNIVRNYYVPNSFINNGKVIADKFDYKCERQKKDGHELKSVACEVFGEFDRPSWLYVGGNSNSLTFDKTVKVKGDIIYVEKNINGNDKIPLDVMLVLDVTTSMDEEIKNPDGKIVRKIDALHSVLDNVVPELLSKEGNANNTNRVGFTSFSLGAQQRNNINYCHFPYYFNQSFSDSIHDGKTETDPMREFLLEKKHIDFEKTISNISKFTGEDLPDQLEFGSSAPKSDSCKIEPPGISTTKLWYTPGQQAQLLDDFKKIIPYGPTLASSGMLIGTNLLHYKSQEGRPLPKESGINTKRILLVMSDGVDEMYFDKIYQTRITTELSHRGMCDKIREKLDSLQDPNYEEQPSKVAFVAFAFGKKINPVELKIQMEGWDKCVGKENVYWAENEIELLDSFRQVIGLTEEVGHATIKKSNF